ncbi:MAG: hypothetical protein F9K23_08735 [Bacteroidetes bacterium]|nr:MAG: hypothetical protein F9K23_08735 [Bacteroidota bacterium]
MISTPFELHITVADVAFQQLDSFIELCHQMGGKPLLIELSRGDYCSQPMFNAIVKGSDISYALEIAKEHAVTLNGNGFEVNRLKIEVPAFNYNLVTDNSQLQNVDYFEWHGKVDFEREALLLQLCEKNGAHLSKNALKDNERKRYVTLREFGDKTIFDNRILALIKNFEENNYTVYKQQAEYCVYDTNVLLDKNWLPDKFG